MTKSSHFINVHVQMTASDTVHYSRALTLHLLGELPGEEQRSEFTVAESSPPGVVSLAVLHVAPRDLASCAQQIRKSSFINK